MQLVQGIVEKGGPQTRAVPKVLVPKKGEVSRLRDFTKKREARGIEREKLGLRLPLGPTRPACGGFVDFGSTDIDAREVDFAEGMAEELAQETSLIRAAAGEIEKMAIWREFTA